MAKAKAKGKKKQQGGTSKASGRRNSSGSASAATGRGSFSAFLMRLWRDRRWLLIGFLLLLLASFFFHLFQWNRPYDGDADTEEAREAVEAMQQGKVSEIEAAVAKLEDAAKGDTSSSKARFKKRFQGSIVVGDSVTEGLSLYGWLSESQVFSEIGASVATGDKLFDKAAKTYPTHAFFAFGMNDMGNYSGDAEAFTAHYAELLQSFHETSADTEIYVCGISTPTEAAIEDNSSIGHYQEFNEAIQEMCKDEGYTYIDVSGIFEEHPELYAQDGIHAQVDYYPYWLNLMIRSAKL